MANRVFSFVVGTYFNRKWNNESHSKLMTLFITGRIERNIFAAKSVAMLICAICTYALLSCSLLHGQVHHTEQENLYEAPLNSNTAVGHGVKIIVHFCTSSRSVNCTTTTGHGFEVIRHINYNITTISQINTARWVTDMDN